jgi:hypothetical protein
MKKFCLLFLISFTMLNSAWAQELTSKKGFPILPETGDIGLSIDAMPFFYYIGNMFHGSNYTPPPSWSFPGFGDEIPTYTLQAKYFKDPKTAYRARVRVGFLSETNKNSIADQNDVEPPIEDLVDDKWTNTRVNVVLGAGIEKRRGKGRVQGFGGAMVNLVFGSKSDRYSYGNAFDATHQTPLSTDVPWIETSQGVYIATPRSSRTTRNSGGLSYGLGANVFIGVEYFIAPKISLSGEFSWGAVLMLTGKSTLESENWDPATAATVTKKMKRGGSTYIGVDNYNTGGAINLAFYF